MSKPLANGRYWIGPVGISPVNMDEALESIESRAAAGRSGYVCVANVRTTLWSQNDRRICQAENGAFLTLPDGMPLVWYARLAGLNHVRRVTGPDVMLELLARSASRGYSHYFFGDTESTLEQMGDRIRRDYPQARVLAMRSPPFAPYTLGCFDRYVEEINALEPTFVWVGLGAPKQELWMADVVGRLKRSVMLGVGAAFRFMIGQYRHPPMLVQRMGLEGIYWRFSQNPLEVLRNYTYFVPAWAYLVGRMLAGRLMPDGRVTR